MISDYLSSAAFGIGHFRYRSLSVSVTFETTQIFRLTKQLLYNANKLKPLGKLELLDYLAGTTMEQRQIFDGSV